MKAAPIFQALAALQAVQKSNLAVPLKLWDQCMCAEIALRHALEAAGLTVQVDEAKP